MAIFKRMLSRKQSSPKSAVAAGSTLGCSAGSDGSGLGKGLADGSGLDQGWADGSGLGKGLGKGLADGSGLGKETEKPK